MADQGNGDDDQASYNVAISFLVADEPIAKSLFDLLEGSGLRVFFFPRTQEELAGTNGMESMRAPFLEAQVNVVLYKAPWGETPWTRVESTAIQERCWKDGWESLLFVQVDQNSPLPKWLSPMDVRFALENYPVEQLAGAVKMRVQEHGGKFTALDAVALAKRVRAEQQYLKDREELMSSVPWIQNTVRRSVRETLQEIIRLTNEVNSAHDFNIKCGVKDFKCVMRSGFVSLDICWCQPISNLVSDHESDKCYLGATEFSGAILCRVSQNSYGISQGELPSIISRLRSAKTEALYG